MPGPAHPPRQLSLALFLTGVGHHEAAWRHPSTDVDQLFTARHHHDLAQQAEAAAFDTIFFADSPSLDDGIEHNALGRLEPLLTLASIAAVTERIGLVATASTTYSEPYNLARQLSALDHLSDGRAGWNIVTTSSGAAAENFGLDTHPTPEERYARASEFVEVATRLWDSWQDDAVLADVASGRYADPSRIHRAGFEGDHLRVGGAFPAARSPQGHPVLVQAGSSNAGRAFASRHAEVVFTAHQQLEDAQLFSADLAARAAALGRPPGSIKVLPGLSAFVADTESAARALERELDELTVPAFGLNQLSKMAGVTFTEDQLDDRVPVGIFDDAGSVTDTTRSRRQVVAGIVRREQPTVRTLLHRLAGGRGHRVVAGTPEQVAETMTTWFTQGAADGFTIMPPTLPGSLTTFVEQVLPLLRARGLVREGYTGTTLREHLGLPRPAGRRS